MESDEIALFAPAKKRKVNQGQNEIVEKVKEDEVRNILNDDGETTNQISFLELGLDPWQVETLLGLSIRQPTQVQAACIPKILESHHVVASAKTGSGKTAAFALPILKNLSQDPFGVHTLVLTPTRYPHRNVCVIQFSRMVL